MQRNPFVWSKDKDSDGVLVWNLGNVEISNHTALIMLITHCIIVNVQGWLDLIGNGTAIDTVRFCE